MWITELLRWIKPRLPEGYRAYIGSAPVLAIGPPPKSPDVVVRKWSLEEGDSPGPNQPKDQEGALEKPDEEVAVATLDPGKALYVEIHGRLVAAVELVSPRNKDRPIARDTYTTRNAGYLLEGVHLLLVDVHPRPVNFSFADRIAQELQMRQPALPPPMAVSYRVGEPAATGGRILAIWRRPMTVNAPLPSALLPLTVEVAIPIDLEQTYGRAAADAYLS